MSDAQPPRLHHGHGEHASLSLALSNDSKNCHNRHQEKGSRGKKASASRRRLPSPSALATSARPGLKRIQAIIPTKPGEKHA